MVRLMLEVVAIGPCRMVWAVDSVALHDWIQSMQRPPAASLVMAIQKVADRSDADLRSSPGLWKMLKGTSPAIFEIRRDEARLYCCMKGRDIAILSWEQKKRKASDPRAIARAERLAREILGIA